MRPSSRGESHNAVAAPPTFGILPNAIERFRKRNPGVRLEIQTLPAEEIADRLIIGDIDLGLTMDAITEPLVQSRAIGKTLIVAVMPASAPLAGRDTIAPEDLVGETLISYGAKPVIGRLLDRAFRDRGLKFEPQIEINLSIAAASVTRGTYTGGPIAITTRANGHGITNLSHLMSHARDAAYAIGRIGRFDICASKIAPGLNVKRGPRGPSGVITGDTFSFTSAS